MKHFLDKLKELYEENPTLFGVLLFIDLTILNQAVKNNKKEGKILNILPS